MQVRELQDSLAVSVEPYRVMLQRQLSISTVTVCVSAFIISAETGSDLHQKGVQCYFSINTDKKDSASQTNRPPFNLVIKKHHLRVYFLLATIQTEHRSSRPALICFCVRQPSAGPFVIGVSSHRAAQLGGFLTEEFFSRVYCRISAHLSKIYNSNRIITSITKQN